MFTHLLLPTDGSPLSDLAVQQGIAFARELGTKVTGLHVLPSIHVLTLQSEALEEDKRQFAARMRLLADQYLGKLSALATQSDVACDTIAVEHVHPYLAIIETARTRHCDLIVMASHGRRGMQALLLGSETQKVLTHSEIPVLVLREARVRSAA
ncbi:Nucleotide-binding universal stress protein, UspA family [Variovorax sp. HW608]|uniref:universal stress protein n=1 Tax=Variovorax sp. HW608 TaxID=1034889 RepID=UPI00081FB7A9|nr:universal stress protein [Variovorax sp. HW608]SCK27636.1 Nucleotide-binding universal stress protein, UspA family [Variovorax sp. HW608]